MALKPYTAYLLLYNNTIYPHYIKKHFYQIKDKSILNNICFNRSYSNNYFIRCIISLLLSSWTTFQTQTKYLQVSRTVALNGTNITITEVQKVLSSTSGLNILGKKNLNQSSKVKLPANLLYFLFMLHKNFAQTELFLIPNIWWHLESLNSIWTHSARKRKTCNVRIVKSMSI